MMAGAAAGSAAASGPEPPRGRQYDARVEWNRAFVASPLLRRHGGLQRLRGSVPGLVATQDPRTGATRTLLSRTGYLTASAPTADPLTIAREFLDAHHDALGLTAADLDAFEVTDEVHSSVTGATHIYLRQTHRGLPVYNGQLQINVNRDGRILSVNNGFLPDLATASGATRPSRSAGEAVLAAATHLGLEPAGPPAVISEGPPPVRVTRVRGDGISRVDIEARLMWLPIRSGVARLVWNFQVATLDGRHAYDLTVDAISGKVWTRFDWVADDSYRVYPEPLESPDHAPTPPPADGRQVVVDPADPMASPFGWHDTDGTSGPEFTTHRGNNVHAYDDIDDVDGGVCTSTPSPPAAEPDCGTSLDCDFDSPIDLGTQDPLTYTSAAVTNLFYWNNLIHDIQYHYGFDEGAGNFQANNYGNGGVAGDYVLAEAQDGSGNNNANFCTPPDGQRPRMQMFNWNRTNPRRDGDFDNGIIVHEYGHGISRRLVGGPSNVSCLQNNQQPGEGLSDWWLLAYTAKASDLGTDPRGVGTYARGDPIGGPGVRNKPYSTDPLVNDYTYESISGSLTVHDVGEVWAEAAWKVYWALVDAHGFDPDLRNASGGSGNQRAMLYVNEGLKNTICSPTFTDVRDGILLAAADNFGGEDVCLLWETFAAFGLGEDAVSGGPDSIVPTNGFEVPQSCPGLPILHVQRSGVTAKENPLTGSEFTILRTRDSVPPVTVFYTVSGTATPGVDYVALSGTVEVPAGAATATIPVDPIDDLDVEPDETVIVTLTPDPAYDVGTALAIVVIESDEVLPTLSVEATLDTATEVPASSGLFTVTRSGNIMPAMEVFYQVGGDATPGSDYVPLPGGSISFADGQLTSTLSVDPLDDAEVERVETVELQLLPDPAPIPAYQLAQPFATRATVGIVSDESPPVIFFAETNSLTAFEAGEIPCEYTVTRSGDVSRAGPVFYEFAGSHGPGVDYYPTPGVVDFAAGQTAAQVVVTPIDDNVIERDEPIFLDIIEHPDYDAPSFRPICNIKSDEIIPQVAITASDPFASEPELTNGAFRLTRTLNTSAESYVDLTYSGTATPGGDYAALPATVTMGIGVSILDIPVVPLPDGETEADETVVAKLPFRTLYTIAPPDNATVTILSGDQPCSGNGECDDGQFCNGPEICSGGICAPGSPPVCDDGVACTVDVCNETSDSCGISGDDGSCDNGLYCDGLEVCVPGVGCEAAAGDPCDDGVSCTLDTCDEVVDSCDSMPSDAACDDGQFCNGAETCDPALGCQPGASPCPPGEFCNEGTDFCDPDAQCAVDTDCNDGSDCTTDTCIGGVCVHDCASDVASFPYAEGFENGFGAWSNAGADDFDWTRGSGSTPTSSTGPSGDHTTGSGSYLYIEASGQNDGDVAILDGPCIHLGGFAGASLSFWYHMFGNDIGALEVEVSTDCVNWTNVWSLSGDQGDAWHEASVDLGAHAGATVAVRFVGFRGPGRRGDIAIDDVAVNAIAGLLVQWAGADTLIWNAAPGALRYNVYRGDLADLVDGDADGLPDGGYGSCQNDRDADLTDNVFVDTDLPTPAGLGFQYLVTYTTASTEVAIGSTSGGTPRTVVPCP